MEISDGLVSKIVEKITPEIAAWQNRPLDAVYPFIFMDAMADLKAINEEEAMNVLIEFKEKWQQTYPSCVKSWEEN